MGLERAIAFEMNPKVYNPQSGYIANWNNLPKKIIPLQICLPFCGVVQTRYGDRPTA